MNPDPLYAWFSARGYEVLPHYLGRTSIPLGWRFTHRGCALAWRCEGRRVWIVMFRRLDGCAGLGNPFAVLYVLAEAVSAELGPGFTLYGNVDVLSGSPLSSARLGRFYRHWAMASEPERGWFELEATQALSMRNVRKRQKLDHP